MFETTLVRKILAAAAGCTLILAVGVGVAAVAHPGGDTKLSAASASAVQPTSRGPASVAAQAVASTPVTAPAALAPTAPPADTPKVTAAPTTGRARPTPTVPAAAPPPDAPPQAAPAPAPDLPAKAARRTPSATEVQAAISGLVQRIGGLLRLVSPTAAQIDRAGDEVCTAFDNGQTFAQVKATGLSMVPSSVTVTPATADWAVRTAVSMYCPDHSSNLV